MTPRTRAEPASHLGGTAGDGGGGVGDGGDKDRGGRIGCDDERGEAREGSVASVEGDSVRAGGEGCRGICGKSDEGGIGPLDSSIADTRSKTAPKSISNNAREHTLPMAISSGLGRSSLG